MSDTKPAELTLAIKKLSKGFIKIAAKPTYDDIFNIRQLLVPIFMSTKYDELKNENNLSGVILPQIRYENMYGVGQFTIPLLVSLYDILIVTDATSTEVHRAEGANESKRNDRALFNTVNTGYVNFIMSVVKDTWFKELEDPDTFYTKFTTIKFIDQLTEHCSDIHVIDAVDIPHIM